MNLFLKRTLIFVVLIGLALALSACRFVPTTTTTATTENPTTSNTTAANTTAENTTTTIETTATTTTVTTTTVTTEEITTAMTTTEVTTTTTTTQTTDNTTEATTTYTTTTSTFATTTSSTASLESLDYTGYNDYYSSIVGSDDVITDMANLLRSTISYVTYGDARYIYQVYDNGSQVVLYDYPTSISYRLVPATGTDGWGVGGDIPDPDISVNREHVWARSDMRIMPDNGQISNYTYDGYKLDDGSFYHSPGNSDRGLYSDLFNLWISLASPNSVHGDNFFGEEAGVSAQSYLQNNAFYPGDEYRGDIARMLFYMTLMYPYLTLVDKGDVNAVTGSIYYGYLNVLLRWNEEDPPSYYEIAKNNLNFQEQSNRNPFVDFYDQDFAELLFASGDPNVPDS